MIPLLIIIVMITLLILIKKSDDSTFDSMDNDFPWDYGFTEDDFHYTYTINPENDLNTSSEENEYNS